ncbi:shikimate dehydrogenase [Bacillus sp. Marseille-Q3570]|uniref:shikimate dehydrogenase n=1 Tax=Bacillus sp. Marseille-Q3570 TaxID=2963522 RepID=UPI0021B7C8A7|nr:shikimate dehydrogenase [Bacillus sp. Marseille-Q3570]
MYDKRLSEYAVIGDPIIQSMSPEIHNACFKQLGIDAKYEAVHVRKEELVQKVQALIESGYKGFNVTIPHKLDIINLLDEMDPFAKAIGAVNTVIVEGSKLKGYNTDGPGFYQSLLEVHPLNLKESNILIIGAGGAARAIVKAFLLNGVEQVTVTNRTEEKAVQLLEGSNGQTLPLEEAASRLAQYDIVINTTPIGMVQNINGTPISLDYLEPHTVLVDIIYNPLMTKFLKTGLEKGCTVQNGVPMFIHQAALSFELWTGRKPDLGLMKWTVEQKLGGK